MRKTQCTKKRRTNTRTVGETQQQDGCRKKEMCVYIFTHDVYLRVYHMNLFAVFQKPQDKMTKLPECE